MCCGREQLPDICPGDLMADLAYVAVTAAVFALVALAARGVAKL
ncbi:hypothetical protein [Streptomyces sp. XM4193]|nr:hypothetical protein [Streptomyces sp. XM4193]